MQLGNLTWPSALEPPPLPLGPLDHAICQHQESPLYRRLSVTPFLWEHTVISDFVYGSSLI